MKIIYFDNHLIVAFKPFGVATQKSLEHKDNLEDQVKEWLKKKYDKPGNVFLHAVHRLDLMTAGIVVLAKTEKALKRMNESIKKGEFNKIYFAVVEGSLKEPKGELVHYLKHKDFKTDISETQKDGYKKCELEYEVLERVKGVSLVKIKLLTGRYHQIRGQFSYIGNPVVGDAKYGSKTKYGKNKIALIHKEVELVHPIKKEKMTFSVDLPKEWPWDIFKGSGS
ncbi:RluA family pseudouridine synthase [Deferribacterales bacterium Es71-Z0220]|uniref:RluA family pseudouridine synthase n=1 Tax=Deferrivibrio essentukiensis TaxID=2880922 RepID=UPI001F6145F0|nr:RluA family pseudouridine synthase [Deferrivibrio essentukiensis]